MEGAAQELSSLDWEISKALAGISGKLVAEVEQLTSIREAAERLHKIDIAATAIDHLAQDYHLQIQLKRKYRRRILRELVLKEEEKARLQKEAAEFPACMKKEVDAAVVAAVNSSEQRFEQQTILLKKDSESKKDPASFRSKHYPLKSRTP